MSERKFTFEEVSDFARLDHDRAARQGIALAHRLQNLLTVAEIDPAVIRTPPAGAGEGGPKGRLPGRVEGGG